MNTLHSFVTAAPNNGSELKSWGLVVAGNLMALGCAVKIVLLVMDGDFKAMGKFVLGVVIGCVFIFAADPTLKALTEIGKLIT
ncbi:hypothetical protein [Streptomyces sp. NPDC059708]|uniref:hypothetical protein n=1 Tax=Streptomyces sp. NPDC059708 TaxID=3346916 RepID=UPI0036A82EEA